MFFLFSFPLFVYRSMNIHQLEPVSFYVVCHEPVYLFMFVMFLFMCNSVTSMLQNIAFKPQSYLSLKVAQSAQPHNQTLTRALELTIGHPIV